MKQRVDPVGDDRRIGREIVVGEDLVRGEPQDSGLERVAGPSREKRDVGSEPVGFVLVRGDADQRRLELARDASKHVSARSALEALRSDLALGPQTLEHARGRISTGDGRARKLRFRCLDRR